MKRLLFIIAMLWGVAYGQSTGYLRYDTVRIQRIPGNSTLIIENATRNVTGGVLTNMGGGRTEFVTPSGGGSGSGLNPTQGVGVIYINDSTVRVDTTTISTRAYLASLLQSKLNSTDTAGHWVRKLENNAGNDSIVYWIGGTRFAIKDNGSGGGGTVLPALDTLPFAKWVVVQDSAGNTYRMHNNRRVYNILDYGADTSASFDNTAIINYVLNVAVNNAQFSGVRDAYVLIPGGRYKISGPLLTSVNGTNPNCQIVVPLTDTNSRQISLHIFGQTAPSNSRGALAKWPQNGGGTILESTIRGSGVAPAVIGSPYVSYGFGNSLNLTEVHLENINVRVRTKTAAGADTANTMTAINFSNLAQLGSINNVTCDGQTLEYYSVAPAPGTTGIILPALNNGAYVQLSNTSVRGFDRGFNMNEHVVASNIYAETCNYGIYATNMGHSLYIDRAGLNWNKYNVYLDGNAYIQIGQLSTEHYTGFYGSKWYDFVSDVYKNSGTPYVTIGAYWIGTAGIGITPGAWTTNMTANMSAALLGTGVDGLYINNGTLAQTANFRITGNGVIGTRLAVGPSFIDPLGTVHIKDSGFPSLIVEKTSGGYFRVLGATGGSDLEWNRSKSITFTPTDSVNDNTGDSSVAKFFGNGNKIFGFFPAATSDLSASLYVKNQIAAQQGLVVQGAAGQSVNNFEIRNPSNYANVVVQADGSLIQQTSSGAFTTFKSGTGSSFWQYDITKKHGIQAANDINNAGAANYSVYFFGPTRNTLFGDFGAAQADINARVGVLNNITTQPAIIARGASGQSVNLVEWQNNSGTVLSAIDKDGNLGISLSSPAARVDVGAGSSSVGLMRFASSTDLSSPTAGSWYYNGTRLGFSPSTTIKRVALTNDAAPSNGQIPIGNGTDYTVAAITGTTNRVDVSNGSGTITLSTPQDIHTGATPTFQTARMAALSTGGDTDSMVVVNGGTFKRIARTDGFTTLTTSTTNATPFTIATIPFATHESSIIEVYYTGVAANGDAIQGTFTRWYTDAGSGTLTPAIGSVHSSGGLSASSVDPAVSGSNFLLIVTGVAATNINWTVKYIITTATNGS